MLLHRPRFADQFPGLVIGQSFRHGGHSLDPYNSLNLGLYTQDESAHVYKNWQQLCQSLDITYPQVATSYQVHQTDSLYATKGGHHQGYDALYTDQAGVYVAVGVADCTPVLVYDAQQHISVAIHAGWRGTVGQIVGQTLANASHQLGLRPKHCWAFVGACISERHFQVDADVADHFAERHKRWEAAEQKFYVDLKTANQEQLLAAGIPAAQIEVSPYCTVADNERFFSHRLERGTTGRMVGIVGRRTAS